MKFEITPTSTATAVGLFCATSFFAVSTCMTFMVMPALCLPAAKKQTKPLKDTTDTQISSTGTSPSHLARQWKALYNDGARLGPFTNGIGAVLWLYVASMLPSEGARARNLYIAGAICLVGVVPFTLTVMARTVNELSDRAATADSGQLLPEETSSSSGDTTMPTSKIIMRWSRMNFVRGLLGITGIACVIAANM